MSVIKIVTLRKGREGHGFTYYAIQRVWDKKYLGTNEDSWVKELYGNNTMHFDTHAQAKNKAIELGFEPCPHKTERFDPGVQYMYCILCGEETACSEERGHYSDENLVWIYVDGVVTYVNKITGHLVAQ